VFFSSATRRRARWLVWICSARFLSDIFIGSPSRYAAHERGGRHMQCKAERQIKGCKLDMRGDLHALCRFHKHTYHVYIHFARSQPHRKITITAEENPFPVHDLFHVCVFICGKTSQNWQSRLGYNLPWYGNVMSGDFILESYRHRWIHSTSFAAPGWPIWLWHRCKVALLLQNLNNEYANK
jgi:hypothetical protein